MLFPLNSHRHPPCLLKTFSSNQPPPLCSKAGSAWGRRPWRASDLPDSSVAFTMLIVHAFRMAVTELAEVALSLPPEERLELARRLVESVVTPSTLNDSVAVGIRRIEDIARGRV